MNHVLLTFDIDWAPDCVIDHISEKLLARRVRATWFITHSSPAIDRLREHPALFELGIHPNFYPNSDHGSTIAQVIATCMDLVPDAVSMRTHGLFQSTAIIDHVLRQTAIRNDVSLFLSHTPNLRPVNYWWNQRHLLRVPYYWEDDFEMGMPQPCWSAASLTAAPGLKVFDFHPIHVYLNSATLESYQSVKQLTPRLSDLSSRQLSPFIRTDEGPGTLLDHLIDYCAAAGCGLRIDDLTLDQRWSKSA